MISLKRLLELVRYEQEIGKLFWLVNRGGSAHEGDEVGSLNCHDQRSTRIDGESVFVHQLIWLIETGEWATEIDHWDRNRSNNRFSNLRECTHAQNQSNHPVRVDNTSGYRGVRWDDARKRWKASFGLNGCQKRFLHKLDAAIFYNLCAIDACGEFAAINELRVE